MQSDRFQTDQLLQELLAAETAVWRALQQGDVAADCAALHTDFLGVYPSGFAGRDDHTDQLEQGPSIAQFAIEQARVLSLGPDCALLAYRATYRRISRPVDQNKADQNKDVSEESAMYVSSIWRREDGVWINIFSQDTKALPEGLPNPLP
ncbi:DUF4440 domain-containing protein [Phaeobacter sp. C3_T13_0]|uniref:DUF4440 domain-containing protein n=1 Tax=Phaeobacter cretensis TaxID=3342641 RepID=UPI0039BC94DE